MRRIKIAVDALPEGVFLAHSEDLPGFTAEYRGDGGLHENICRLAAEFISIDGDTAGIAIDFEMKG